MPRLGPIGIWELLIIVFVLLLFFGSRRLPDMARGIAQSIGEFRKGIRDMGEDEGKDSAGPDSAPEPSDDRGANGERTSDEPPRTTASEPKE